MSVLPTLCSDLAPESTTRSVLAGLCEAYANKSPDFSQARLILEEWADDLSQADGNQETFPLLSADQDITMRSILESMGRDQASRFLGELFTDVVPHVFSKRRLLQDIKEEKTVSGMEVRRPRLLDPLFRAMEKAPAGLFRTKTQVLSLTWKDDGLNEIHSQMFVSAEVEDGTPRSPSRKGVSF